MAAHLEGDMSGVIMGMVNQNVEPTAGLEAAPMRPPSTATCLLQMDKPRPVPPACRGRRISSSVPCRMRNIKALAHHALWVL